MEQPGDDEVLVARLALDRYRGDPDLLSATERARFRRMRSVVKRRDFVAGRSAMRRVLGDLIDADPRCLEIEYGAHGKPELTGRHRLCFNLSHSGDRAVLAVSRRGPIGVDIEVCRPGRPFRRLARRFFAPSEADWLLGLPSGDVAAGFYRLWTLKEAYLKAIGTGLTHSSRAFCIDPTGAPRLVATSAGQLPAESWALQVLPAEDGHHAALCTPAGQLEVLEISLED